MSKTSPSSRGVDSGVVVAMTGYVAYVTAISVLLGVLNYRPSAVVGVVIALPAAAVVGYAVIRQFRRVNSQEGLERHVQTESLAAAFLVTMLSVVTYALLEAFAALPRLSMWFVWGYGMTSWCCVSAVLRRRYR